MPEDTNGDIEENACWDEIDDLLPVLLPHEVDKPSKWDSVGPMMKTGKNTEEKSFVGEVGAGN